MGNYLSKSWPLLGSMISTRCGCVASTLRDTRGQTANCLSLIEPRPGSPVSGYLLFCLLAPPDSRYPLAGLAPAMHVNRPSK